MFFIAHLEYCDTTDYKPQKYSVVTAAETFSEAMDNIVEHFGERWIQKITLLEPITDNPVLYLRDKTVENEIREHELNGFF